MIVMASSLVAMSQTGSNNRGEARSDKMYVDLNLPSGTLWKSANESGWFYCSDFRWDEGLPTREQWKELKDYCKWVWTGNGYVVAGNNGNTIYLPAEGYISCEGDTVVTGDDQKVRGYYWSSSPYYEMHMFFLFFDDNNISDLGEWDIGLCCYKQSVRLIRKK